MTLHPDFQLNKTTLLRNPHLGLTAFTNSPNFRKWRQRENIFQTTKAVKDFYLSSTGTKENEEEKKPEKEKEEKVKKTVRFSANDLEGTIKLSLQDKNKEVRNHPFFLFFIDSTFK